jgi:hypothetical protein
MLFADPCDQMDIWFRKEGVRMKIVTLFVTLLLCVTAWAGEITLAWDPSPTQEIDGYRVWYGTASENYSSVISIGNITEFTVTGLALTKGGMYYFAVTAFEGETDSDFSNEVQTYVAHDTENPMVAPQITGSIQ